MIRGQLHDSMSESMNGTSREEALRQQLTSYRLPNIDAADDSDDEPEFHGITNLN